MVTERGPTVPAFGVAFREPELSLAGATGGRLTSKAIVRTHDRAKRCTPAPRTKEMSRRRFIAGLATRRTDGGAVMKLTPK
jgi:hypothetical protein